MLLILLSMTYQVHAGTLPDFERFWCQALLEARATPVNLHTDADGVSFGVQPRMTCHVRTSKPHGAKLLPPVLYLLDRKDPGSFEPTNSHQWLVLDVRLLTTQQADEGPRCAFKNTVAAAVQALRLLLSNADCGYSKAGVIGEGMGGAVALAVAALAPEDVVFVGAHEPCVVPELERDPYCDLMSFAAQIHAPTLIGVGYHDTIATPDAVLAVHDSLAGPHELAEFPQARHCLASDLADWRETWRTWAEAALDGASTASARETLTLP